MLDTKSLFLILSIERMSFQEKAALAWGCTAKALQRSLSNNQEIAHVWGGSNTNCSPACVMLSQN